MFAYLCGALLITASDVDLSSFLRQERVLAFAFALSCICLYGCYALAHGPGYASLYWVPTLPLWYFLLNAQAVLEMKEGHPTFVLLWSRKLVLSCMVWAANDVLRGSLFKHPGPIILLGSYAASGSGLVWLAYEQNFLSFSKPGHESPTAGLRMALWAYFCLWGTQTFPLDRLWLC